MCDETTSYEGPFYRPILSVFQESICMRKDHSVNKNKQERLPKHERLRRFLAIFLIAVFVLGSLAGLMAPIFAAEYVWPDFEDDVYVTDVYGDWEEPSFTGEDIVSVHYDKAALDKAALDFLKVWGLSFEALPTPEQISKTKPQAVPAEDKARAALDSFLAEYDKFVTQYSIVQFLYSQNVTDQSLKDELQYTKDLDSSTFNLVLETLQGVQKNPDLQGLLAKIIGENYYKDLADSLAVTPTQEENVKKQNALKLEFDGLQNDILNGTTDEEKSRDRIADIYIELVKLRNAYAKESGYSDYLAYTEDTAMGRDYSREDLAKLYQAIKTYIVPTFFYLSVAYDWDALSAYDFLYGTELLDQVGPFLAGISTELEESFNYMRNAGLHKVGDEGTSEQVSYTVSVPSYHSAMIFQFPYQPSAQVSTLIHEFGHFNTAVRQDGWNFFNGSNVDIAEIHSQGMEVLFMPYYKAIYGENLADAAVQDNLLNLLWSIMTGAMYNEFETYTHTEPDLTPEKIDAKYRELAEAYGVGSNTGREWMFYHMFHAPFYYLSYALSALGAATFIPAMVEDYDGAVAKYLELTDKGEEAFGFRALLDEVCLPDVFSENTVKALADAIHNYGQEPFYWTNEHTDGLLERYGIDSGTPNPGMDDDDEDLIPGIVPGQEDEEEPSQGGIEWPPKHDTDQKPIQGREISVWRYVFFPFLIFVDIMKYAS
jgi:hypothetical protein